MVFAYPRIKPGAKAVQNAPNKTVPVVAVPPPPPSAKAVTLATKRRIEKAERDERIDITKALTPVKTYVYLIDMFLPH
jgi:hypothetical protein